MYQLNGKTTDKLIKESKELSNFPNDRELDVLLSVGEQISMSKLAILLNEKGYNTVSLTGWQAGIYTDNEYQNAKITQIDVSRINKELSKENIVIVAGFQGINNFSDITTLGRGGSDTTAIALSYALKAKQCYIYSDVEGIFTADPNKVSTAKKLNKLSYDEMLEIANEGAKVLHNRCVEVGQKFNVPIIARSTFTSIEGTLINNKIEDTKVKSIVKNDNIYDLIVKKYNEKLFSNLYKLFIDNKLFIDTLININEFHLIINSNILDKTKKILKDNLNITDIIYKKISKISIIGYGIFNNFDILDVCIKLLDKYKLNVLKIETSESKMSILFNDYINDEILEKFHNSLII